MPNVRVSRRMSPALTAKRAAPVRSTDELRDRLRRFMEAPFDQPLWPTFMSELMSQPVGMRPPVEMVETPEEFTVTAELPGMERKDIRVEFENGILTVRGEKEETREEKEGDRRYHLWERSYGSFERVFSMDGIDPEKVNAVYKDGVLTVHLPKTPTAQAKGREIPIT